jgi:hypothetical protein
MSQPRETSCHYENVMLVVFRKHSHAGADYARPPGFRASLELVAEILNVLQGESDHI